MTQGNGWWIFDTARGPCGVAWCPDGVTRFLLPDTPLAQMQHELQAVSGVVKTAAAPPAWVHKLALRVQQHCQGKPQDFAAVPVHVPLATDFAQAVYRRARAIPAGAVMTYGELAAAIGKPGAMRAVGSALGRNPVPLLVPCHRIVAASGKPGGFTSPGGLDTKRWLLACEGLSLDKG